MENKRREWAIVVEGELTVRAEFDSFIKAEVTSLGDIVKAAAIKPN